MKIIKVEIIDERPASIIYHTPQEFTEYEAEKAKAFIDDIINEKSK